MPAICFVKRNPTVITMILLTTIAHVQKSKQLADSFFLPSPISLAMTEPPPIPKIHAMDMIMRRIGVLKGVEKAAFKLHCSPRQLQRILNDYTADNIIQKIGKGTYRINKE